MSRIGGDLLAILLIETGEGLKNIDDIASVPGVDDMWPSPWVRA